ncbi:MAG TPA: hypothetical protein VD837_19900 [Terriglobales bacterium]|nr:hypothetical protein [Terriglobales bacterium]
MRQRIIAALLGTSLLFTLSVVAADQKPLIQDYASAVISAPADFLRADPFYKKYVDAEGIAILSSEKVPDSALLVARDIAVHMLANRPDIRAAMVAERWRVGVMAQSESTTDIPEHRNLKKPGIEHVTAIERAHYDRIAKLTDKQYWDKRARGLGGNPTTCAEENLLGYPGTRYFGENIFVHEFSHAIHQGIRLADPKLAAEIDQAYRDAMQLGLWKNSYGETNSSEYWAEGTQFWFHSNYEYVDGNTRINTPLDLLRYDPKLYELLSRVYPDHRIPADVYHGKQIPPPPTHKPGAMNVLQ